MITPRISRRHVQDDVAGIVSRTSGVPTLEVSDLVKRYGDVLALDGCSLQVPAGHLVPGGGAQPGPARPVVRVAPGKVPDSLACGARPGCLAQASGSW